MQVGKRVIFVHFFPCFLVSTTAGRGLSSFVTRTRRHFGDKELLSVTGIFELLSAADLRCIPPKGNLAANRLLMSSFVDEVK